MSHLNFLQVIINRWQVNAFVLAGVRPVAFCPQPPLWNCFPFFLSCLHIEILTRNQNYQSPRQYSIRPLKTLQIYDYRLTPRVEDSETQRLR